MFKFLRQLKVKWSNRKHRPILVDTTTCKDFMTHLISSSSRYYTARHEDLLAKVKRGDAPSGLYSCDMSDYSNREPDVQVIFVTPTVVMPIFMIGKDIAYSYAGKTKTFKTPALLVKYLISTHYLDILGYVLAPIGRMPIYAKPRNHIAGGMGLIGPRFGVVDGGLDGDMPSN